MKRDCYSVGFPFEAVSGRCHSETHVCYEGPVYVGYMTEEDGEEVECVDVSQLWYLEGWESMLCT